MPPPPAPATTDDRVPWWRSVPVLIIGAVVLFGLGGIAGAIGAVAFDAVGEGFADGISSGDVLTYGPGGDLEVFDMAPGQCAREDVDAGSLPGTSGVVDCTSSHRTEAFASLEPPHLAPGEPVNGDDLAHFADSACFLSFEPYVGRHYADSELEYLAVIPSAAAWRAGSRTVHCVLFHLDGDSLHHSARDSGI